MQVGPKPEVAALLDRLVAEALPDRNGLEAWSSLLQAHATLMRRLEVDLAQDTRLALADFDVLAQLANAGGELRMAELAARALISRSGMTRRVTRLVDEGLVRRANADGDARAVVVALADAGEDLLAVAVVEVDRAVDLEHIAATVLVADDVDAGEVTAQRGDRAKG